MTYERHGVPVIRDTYKSVQMLETSDKDIETGLRLALAKFGTKLSLTGDPEFQRRAAEIAVEQNMRIEFTDPALNEIMIKAQERKVLVDEFRKSKQRPEAKHQPETKQRPVTKQQPETAQQSDSSGKAKDVAAKVAKIKPKPAAM